MGVWNPKANAMFLQTVEMSSPDQRATFLDEACAGDPALRAEVEQLLKSHDAAGSFLERPLLGDQQTQDSAAETDRDGPPGAEVSLDFLEPCDEFGRLGKIGPYEVIDVIGVGGMGVVLRAHDPKLNRIVAVKVMAPQFIVNPTARKRFLREAQAAAAVTHPHVVAIHAVDQTEKMPYLVMEYIDGLSLEEKIVRCGHLGVKEILRIGAQIAAGLAAAHLQGLVHRDIKPSNILLEDGVERVRITDFGLARAVDDVGVTRSGDVAGTPQYMSPEQAQGNPVDARSDLFSLGAVLYAMCTGRSPFRAETAVAVLRRVCDDAPRPIWEVNPDIPEPLVTIIDRLLAKDPEERFQMAQEVSDRLLLYLAHLQDPAGTPPPEPLSIRLAADRKTCAAGAAPVGRRRRRALMVAATVLLGVCVSVAVTEATGVTQWTAAILRIATGAGTLVVEVDDPQVSITIDGEDLVITGAGPQEVRLKAGQYRVQAAKGGQVVKQELVTIERGGRQVVRVALEPSVTLPASRGLGFSLGDDQEQPSDSRAKTTDAVDAILLNPQGAQACWVRALTLFHEGDFEEGIAQLDEAIRLDRQPKHYWRRGIAYRDLGMFDRSLADLNELFRTPEYRGGDYYTERGLTCLLKGDLDRAIADSAEMILLRPTAPEGYLIRAGTHWVKRDFDRALADCDKAVELLKHRNCYYYRAECCRDKGDFPRALSDLSEVIRLEPTYAEGYRKRALVRIQLGQFNEASDDVAQAIELSRQNGLGKHQMAWFLATTEEPRLRDVERAVQLASEAVSVSPSSILLQNTLGAAQYRAGNWKAALAAFEKAERLRGLLGAGGWFFRAMTHWQLGQQDQARASYDEAVKRAAEVHFLDQDLHRFRVEAAELLGIPEKPPTAKEEPGKSK